MVTKVKTTGYIRAKRLDKKSSACGCSGIDGTNEIDVREFQKWANVTKTSGLAEDGKFGKLTKAEYDKYGPEWESSKEIKPTETKNIPPVPVETKKELSLTEKWKLLSTNKKVLVISGGVLVATGVIVLIWKLIPKK